jgi:hypothetical protein
MDRLSALLARWQATERRKLATHLPLWVAAAIGAGIFAAVLLALACNFRYLHGLPGLIPNDDVFAYECYGRGFWRGAQALTDAPITRYCADPRWLFWTAPPEALHTLPREYPAPAVLLFSLPLLLPATSYAVGYMLLMATLIAGGILFLVRRRLPLCGGALGAYIMLGGWGTALERFDLVPGLLVLGAVVLAERSRWAPAYLLLAAAALLKIYPGFVAVVLAAHQWRRQGRPPRREALLFLAALAVGTLPFAFLNVSGLLAPLRYNGLRPPHIESVAGSLLWLSGKIGGSTQVRLTYHSVNVYGVFSGFAAWSATVLFLAGVALVTWRARRGRESLGRSVVLLLLVMLATSKLLSPQYLLWLFPVAAYVEGLRLRWLLLAGLTLVIYPYGYQLDHSLVRLPQHPLFMTAILARNALLVAITVWYLLCPERQSAGA